MTAYWPTRTVMRALTEEQRVEIMNAHRGIPAHTMVACHYVTSKLPADTTLAIIRSEGAGTRRVYLQYPSYEQWVALEQGGFIETWNEFGFVMDALH